MSRRADLAAARLLMEHGIVKPPVPVTEIARSAGAKVVFAPYKGDVSGILFRGGDQDVIGVNSDHVMQRQRFTVAHELGHRALHPGRELILDVPVRVNFRDRTSSMATDREEIEANAFAAALLMPEQMIRTAVEDLPPGVRRDPEVTAQRLAKVFNVSITALGFRLINLGLTS